MISISAFTVLKLFIQDEKEKKSWNSFFRDLTTVAPTIRPMITASFSSFVLITMFTVVSVFSARFIWTTSSRLQFFTGFSLTLNTKRRTSFYETSHLKKQCKYIKNKCSSSVSFVKNEMKERLWNELILLMMIRRVNNDKKMIIYSAEKHKMMRKELSKLLFP